MPTDQPTDDDTDRLEHPRNCTECGSAATDVIETDTTITGDFVRRFSCEDCYAGFEVRYIPVSKETYHDPEHDA